MQKELVIQKLREKGCRITKQRLMLLDIILEEDPEEREKKMKQYALEDAVASHMFIQY